MTDKRAIVVLGMHRSGTSAGTRVLSLCGATLPRHIAPPTADNPSGFWEPARIVEIHEDLLRAAGSSWDDFSEFPQSWFASDLAKNFKARLVDALHDEFRDAELFVVKDPRICRLVPCWLSVLQDFGAEPLFIIMVRNPLEVSASLKARDGFSQAKSMLLWLRHLLSAERDTRAMRRSFVTYEDLLTNWQGVVARLNRELDLRYPSHSHSRDVEINAFLSAGLRHHVVAAEHLAAREDVADWVKIAFDWATRAAHGELMLARTLDSVYETLRNGHLAFAPLVQGQKEEMEAQTQRERLEAQKEEIVAWKVKAAQLTNTVADLQPKLARLTNGVIDLDRRLEERERRLEAVYTSMSWRITAPLRAAGRALLGALPPRLSSGARRAPFMPPATCWLARDEVRQFHEQGYLGPYVLCTPDEMAEIRGRIEREVLTRPGPAGDVWRFRHLDCRVVYDLCAHPAIIERVACIYGPHLLLWRSRFFSKSPGDGQIPWHQDSSYWPIQPSLTLSAWVAIDPSTAENSCVQVIPGSHGNVVPHVTATEDMEAGFRQMADPAYVDASQAVNIELMPGEFFLFNERVLHHSEPNRSDRRRLGLAARMTVPFVRVDHRRLFEGHKVIVVRGEDYMGLNETASPPVD